MMKKFLALLLFGLLGGCFWTGPVHYKPDPSAAQPITPGRYEGVDNRGQKRVLMMVRTKDGSVTALDDKTGKEQEPVFFVPLAVEGRELWITELFTNRPGQPGAIYGLAEKRGDTLELLPVIECKGTTDMVKAAGGKIVPIEGATDGGVTCVFEDKAALEKALIAYARANPKLPDTATLKPYGR